MSRLSAAEQTEINLSVGAVVVGNYLSAAGLMTGLSQITRNPAALAFIHWGVPAEGFLLEHVVSVCSSSMHGEMSLHIELVYGLLDVAHFSNTQAGLGSQPHPTRALGMVGVGADVLITSSMIYYLDLRFRIELHKTPHNQASYHIPPRFRRLIVRTVECNLLSLLVQAMAIALFDSSIKVYYPITNMMIAKVYTFSLLVSLNCRHSENGPETSNGEHSSSSSRGEGGIVELTVTDRTALSDIGACGHGFPPDPLPYAAARALACGAG
ncbi:hypothetical protein BT96DRAFT_1008791 [Gymnopus androsaceus JB14]|uniref:DUF6534 domain-containing protein n=1 Tax=Gymnopus androsaceus JB14 TaxID=1447944 RepID=A0A6A4GE51_9AGAR|nr:hypothetical protein BT96DRAFT_1008791 [Gymnopus androsaceus JB14]